VDGPGVRTVVTAFDAVAGVAEIVLEKLLYIVKNVASGALIDARTGV
jgi:hypothetical protein